MRLTLRTLLAYLDNTLEPQDAEILRTKLAESGFATQLVSRIRASLTNPDLSAPAPDAVSPVEEANVICEYLDSTLSPQQVAEIERACLESETHLAEAAACHQILTMVLGQPAQVSPQLRRRVYELPDRELKEMAASSSFSSLKIPDAEGSAFDGVSRDDLSLLSPDEIATLDQPASKSGRTVRPSEPVTPVGPGDSGVSDAPTRLRDAGVLSGSGVTGTSNHVSGSIQRSDMYGGSIRPSRIAPWLVSLALAGVLLFALAQIFSPLLGSRMARQKGGPDTNEEIVVYPDEAPPMVEIEPLPTDSEFVEMEESLPAPAATKMESDETTSIDPQEVEVTADSNPVDQMPLPTADKSRNGIGTPDDPVLKPMEPETNAAENPAETPAVVEEMTSVAGTASDAPSEPESPSPENESETEAVAVGAQSKGIPAKVLSEKTILVGRIGEGDWVRLNRGATIGSGVSIACAPLFQGHLTSEVGVDIMMIGATNLNWEGGTEDLPAVLEVDRGRVLIGSLEKDVNIGVRGGDTLVKLVLDEPETVVAVTRSHLRAPGFDPLKPENHLSTVSILVVQGEAELTLDGGAKTLTTGQSWSRQGDREPEIEQVESPPTWIENPDAGEEAVYTLARETLLELVESKQPILKSLREATAFRRSEVAALAGRALLAMEVGDVYFGGDGLLSQADQRNYWSDHYRALLETMDHDSHSAAQLQASIQQMESADAETLYRLLVGYSQKQLVEGADKILVGLLDSNSMAVRVLARENLRAITGITLNFKAEQDNAVRRAPEIKKWLVRQGKGDIRWQATP